MPKLSEVPFHEYVQARDAFFVDGCHCYFGALADYLGFEVEEDRIKDEDGCALTCADVLEEYEEFKEFDLGVLKSLYARAIHLNDIEGKTFSEITEELLARVKEEKCSIAD